MPSCRPPEPAGTRPDSRVRPGPCRLVLQEGRMQDQLVFVLDVEELVPLAAGEEARDAALNTIKRACLR